MGHNLMPYIAASTPHTESTNPELQARQSELKANNAPHSGNRQPISPKYRGVKTTATVEIKIDGVKPLKRYSRMPIR